MQRVLLLAGLALLLGGCEFNKAQWAGRHGRLDMVCDAVAAGVAPGTGREAVRVLLGPPDHPSDDELPHMDSYDLGADLGFDTVLLSIEYNDQGVVREVVQTHDWGSLYLRPMSPGDCGGNWSFQRENQ